MKGKRLPILSILIKITPSITGNYPRLSAIISPDLIFNILQIFIIGKYLMNCFGLCKPQYHYENYKTTTEITSRSTSTAQSSPTRTTKLDLFTSKKHQKKSIQEPNSNLYQKIQEICSKVRLNKIAATQLWLYGLAKVIFEIEPIEIDGKLYEAKKIQDQCNNELKTTVEAMYELGSNNDNFKLELNNFLKHPIQEGEQLSTLDFNNPNKINNLNDNSVLYDEKSNSDLFIRIKKKYGCIRDRIISQHITLLTTRKANVSNISQEMIKLSRFIGNREDGIKLLYSNTTSIIEKNLWDGPDIEQFATIAYSGWNPEDMSLIRNKYNESFKNDAVSLFTKYRFIQKDSNKLLIARKIINDLLETGDHNGLTLKNLTNIIEKCVSSKHLLNSSSDGLDSEEKEKENCSLQFLLEENTQMPLKSFRHYETGSLSMNNLGGLK